MSYAQISEQGVDCLSCTLIQFKAQDTMILNMMFDI